MHPALSVIFFTVISGAGYGLLFLLGLGLIVDPQLVARNEVLLVLVVGAGAAAAGLMASLFHLGQPQRAWRALSQWRSSWLSREGVSALASFVPVCALAVLIWRGVDTTVVRACALALAALATATVFCTAQIYASLKTIHAWNNRQVVAGYLLLGLLAGAAWLLCAHALFWPLFEAGDVTPNRVQCVLAVLVLLLALTATVWKISYWRFLDRSRHAATIESATGLGSFGTVRSAETPHTEENYLLREMGFVLARKHAARLRQIAALLIGLVPVPVASLLLWPPIATSGWLASACAAAIAASVTAGCFVERWLFFAEARHVVTLYYGAEHV
ncbi:MAG TPA: DmsC/YnfH family molybdoenzyme membrane anchor subunit [Rudaea sp.]|jgi:DMSO reductase anchor subunit|uniref:dimethyl sulfoxide reductase anchor subunit family protein n=1 Tax=Rudaea sp. TaxID=2136325 RepID=UPI002F921820